ncbi:MAG: hypothetical protein ACO1OB_27570 [Archangium sp.]
MTTPYFPFDGRGPVLTRWLHENDLSLVDSAARGHIVGAQHEAGWVVFHGLQVLQLVPEEVHSYWHREKASG